MNKKLRESLSELCKDMGLTDKALDELSELGSQGLTENSTDEEVKKSADLLVPYARLMQGEITRKTRKTTPQNHNQTPKSKNSEGGNEGEDDNSDIANIIAKQLAPFKAQLEKLQGENDSLKAERAKSERSASIVKEAKKLGIPDYLMKRITIADDADIVKELTDIKQDLVNNNLMPKDAASEKGTTAEAMKADAKSWAASLPNK